MARPGTVVTLRDTPSVASVPTDTGTWFVTGLTERGPLTPVLVRSLDEFVAWFGGRVAYSVLYDSMELFFREGGNRAYVSRVVGPTPTYGTQSLLDTYGGGGTASLTVTANGPGDWSANYKIQVLAGGGAGTFKIQVQDLVGTVLEDSGDLLDNAAAVVWGQTAKYVRIALGPNAADPAIHAATVLSTGTDDRGNIVDANWATALALFTTDYGPGQVSAPGRAVSTGWSQLAAHAVAMNRVALLDMANISTAATLQAAAAAVNSRFSAAFAPWVVIPGITVGTTRTVPPSALIAGLIGKNDPAIGTNHPSAGRYGQSRIVTDLSQAAWDDTTRQALNGSGVNVIRRMFQGIRVYGWRSTTNAVSDANWIAFGNARLYMELVAELNEMAENFVFEEIDGQHGTTIGAFHDGGAGVVKQHFDDGELFGETSEEAFNVDTGPSVNTLVTIAAQELHMVVAVKMAGMSEYVAIEVVKRQISEAVV